MKRRTSRRPSPDREIRRGTIIAAAVRLFAQRGMENVSYGDIAREAGLSRPLVYFYFPDLETLFLEALSNGAAAMHRAFLAAVKPADSGLEQIMGIGRAYVTFARENPDTFELMAHNESKQSKAQAENPLQQQCMLYYDGIMGLLVSALVKGVRDGSIRKDIGDPAKVAVCLWGLTHGLIQLAATKRDTLETNFGSAAATLPGFGLDLICRSLQAPKPKLKS
jgi:AcrR family transcriptional regulator